VKVGVLLIIALGAFAAERGSLVQDATTKARPLTNPFDGYPRAPAAGARLYRRQCAACHGRNARGSGKAPSLIRAGVAEAPPGALFWVLKNGSLDRGMPSFAHLPEARRWQIISYLRTLREQR
jgi:mono/diheme cytochrome c family protein